MNNGINKELIYNLFTKIKNEIFENGTDEEYNKYAIKIQSLQLELFKGEDNMSMKNKSKKDSKLEPKVVEGYAIYSIDEEKYVNSNYYMCSEDEFPNVYEDIKRAKEDIEEEMSEPECMKYTNLKYTLQVEEVYKREIIYNLVAGEIE